MNDGWPVRVASVLSRLRHLRPQVATATATAVLIASIVPAASQVPSRMPGGVPISVPSRTPGGVGGGGSGVGTAIGIGVGIGVGTAVVGAITAEEKRRAEEERRRQLREQREQRRGRAAPPSSETAAQRQTPSPPRVLIPAANENRFVPDEILVVYRSSANPAAIERLVRQHRLTRLSSEQFRLVNARVERYRLPPGANVRRVLQTIARADVIERAQPNFLYGLVNQWATGATAPPPAPAEAPYATQAIGSDTSANNLQALQYAVQRIQAVNAHSVSRGERVNIAVIDSGIDIDHPELQGTVARSLDAIGGETRPHAHGTAMAGAIAARARLVGVAPAARLIAIRAFAISDDGKVDGTTVTVMRGLDLAQEAGARLVNMSFAGPHDPLFSQALEQAKSSGMILIAATGNLGPRAAPQFPAADPCVIAVTATDAKDALFGTAVRGNHVAVAAPGVDILVPAVGGAYDMTTGTSVAAAHVTGVVALMLQRNDSLDSDKVRQILTSTARDLGAPGRDPLYGSGLVDAMAAVQAAVPIGVVRGN